MKKTILIFTIVLISLLSARGQNPFISCIINFEDNPCWEGSYYSIDIPFTNNIWHVCQPGKTVFDSSYSSPNAILTDSSGPYPVNNTSSFIIKFVPYAYCMCAPVIGGYYKFDSDTLKDFGRIEFSLDRGTTWLNALSDTVIPDVFWITPKPILTGRIHQWTEFLAFVPGYMRNDTLYYRFTFVSDSIQTNQDGWMLDNLELIDHTEGVQDLGPRDEINIYPNPSAGMITVTGNKLAGDVDVTIYDIRGQFCLQKTIHKNKEDIDISSLQQGVYLVKALSKNNYSVRMIIKD